MCVKNEKNVAILFLLPHTRKVFYCLVQNRFQKQIKNGDKIEVLLKFNQDFVLHI